MMCRPVSDGLELLLEALLVVLNLNLPLSQARLPLVRRLLLCRHRLAPAPITTTPHKLSSESGRDCESFESCESGRDQKKSLRHDGSIAGTCLVQAVCTTASADHAQGAAPCCCRVVASQAPQVHTD